MLEEALARYGCGMGQGVSGHFLVASKGSVGWLALEGM